MTVPLSGCNSACSVGSVVSASLDWKISESASSTRHAHSASNKAQESYVGIEDWTGTVNGVAVEPPIFPGTDFVFIGSTEGTVGVTAPARCVGMTVVIDYSTATPVMWTLNIAAQGAAGTGLVRGPGAALDLSTPLPVIPKSFIESTIMVADVAATPDYAALANSTKFTINMTEAAGTYSSSTTRLFTGRTPGVIDLNFTIEGLIQDTTAYTDWPDTNDVQHVQAWVNATQHWDIDWMRMTGCTYGAALADQTIPVTITGVLAALQNAGDAPDGKIITPGSTTIWP